MAILDAMCLSASELDGLSPDIWLFYASDLLAS